MIRTIATGLTTVCFAFSAALWAQSGEPGMTPEQKAMMEAYARAGTPGPEHARLAQSVGNYLLEVRSWDSPGAPPRVESGSASREMMLDGRVLVEQLASTMMGQPFTGHGMHGFDNVTGKHWSTWNDSMSTGLMTSEGSCDAQGLCTFTGSWNDPVTKQEVTARMTSRWTGPDTQLFEMHGPGPDGKEMKMMEIVYTRQ